MTTPSITHERIGRWLLVVAYAALLSAGLRGLTSPWENSLRGYSASMYIDVAVHAHLTHGLAVTHGAPTMVMATAGAPTVYFGWHHPPLYTLCITAAAWLFGHNEAVLRLAQLVLFLPGIAALFFLLRRHTGPLAAGVATLLFATTPLVGYFGPMVMQTSATMSLGLLTMWIFDRYLAAPSARRWWMSASAFFLTCSMDINGYFWGFALFGWALALAGWRRAFRLGLSMFIVSLLALVALALHYGTFLGGVTGFCRAFLGLAAYEKGAAQEHVHGARAAAAARELFLDHGAWPLFVAAALGAITAASAASRKSLWLGLWLMVPGLVNYVAFLPHALGHVFWSMDTFAGLALIASGAAIVGLDVCQRAWLPARALGLALLAAIAATAVTGVLRTHALVTKFATANTALPPVIQASEALIEGCSVVMTSATVGARVVYGNNLVIGGIDNVELFDLVLHIGKANAVPGEAAFLLHPMHAGTPLAKRLDQLAAPRLSGDVAVYRWKLQ